MLEMYRMYAKNEQFKAFVDEFTRKHRTTVDAALKCMQVIDEFKRLNNSI